MSSASIEFRKYFTKKSLNEIYKNYVCYKGAIGIDRINRKVFKSNLESNIEVIWGKAHKGDYRFTNFKEKLLSRGADRKPRVISIPTKRDQLILRALYTVLNNTYRNKLTGLYLYKIINEVKENFLSKRYDYFLRLDIKDFYPSIIHNVLLKIVKRKVRKKEIVNLIYDAIKKPIVSPLLPNKIETREKGIPQGLAISNILANIYLQLIDKKYYANIHYSYFRYVDDILVLSNSSDTKSIKDSLMEDLKNIGLEIHDESKENSKSESGSIDEGFSYLGYKFKGDSIFVRESSIDSLRNSLIKIFTQYKYREHKKINQLRWVINLRITGCIFNSNKYGWIFFFSQINDLNLLFKLDSFIKELCKRYNVNINLLRPKKFVKTYFEITKNLRITSYIPNFDKISKIEKSKILKINFGIKVNESQVIHEFNKLIYRNIKELEKDLAMMS